ncbi:hypothetical protein BKA70DRAFT_527891 [Coprinopsis sp. MPI-PUGE-AT-0042]|nr:hypothetical protein BKA70DRAFT_527891 [Coprinopsis sp. MPI-PUGE-AT-0042]
MARSAFILLSFLGTVYAANDWSKACLGGVCYYDLPSSSQQPASGTLKIWGSSDAISDITNAAGWEIIDCQKDAVTQDIRLVCTGNDAACAHLYKVGAEGKVVRLPENCGANAFARVSKAWVPENQSIPANIAKRLVRRQGVQPEVKALSLDTNFAGIDTKKTGVINFALTGANIPGAQDITSFPNSKSASKQRRQFFDNILNNAANAAGAVADAAGDAVDAAGDAVDNAVDAVVDVAGDVVDVVQDAADDAGDFVNDAVNAVQGLNEVSIDESITFDPIEINESFNVIDQTLACGAIAGSLKIDVAAKARALATIGVAAQGTIAPPSIDNFAITATVDGDIDGVIKMIAGISGSIESPELPLLDIGIPGLNFPGIFTLGPSFTVSAQATANLDLTAEVDVGVNYKFEKATFVFPPNAGNNAPQDNAFKVGDTPLKLSVTPSVKATGRVEAHLIPSLNLGISALGDVAEATVFLNLDASAALQLELEASGGVRANIGGAPAQGGAAQGGVAQPQRGAAQPQHDAAQPQRGAAKPAGKPKHAAAQPQHAAAQPQHAQPKQAQPKPAAHPRNLAIRGAGPMGARYFAKRQTNVEVDPVGFGGCFSILAGLDVNVGADASFFGLFDVGTEVPLFSREFNLFERCFGNQANQANRRRSVGRLAYIAARSSPINQLEKRVLACPVQGASARGAGSETLVDEVVPANQITPVA